MGIFGNNDRSFEQPLVPSLTASAQRMTSKRVEARHGLKANQRKNWQHEAWAMFDSVGEQRFLATTLAQRMGQARFYVGKVDAENPEMVPKRAEDEQLNDLLGTLAGAGRMQQIVTRMGTNMFIAGDCWLLGVPEAGVEGDFDQIDLTRMEWHLFSVEELVIEEGGKAKISDASGLGLLDEYNLDDVYLIRIWRPHPRKWSEADSPTRASLPILRELVALTQHVGAQIDSRLAGAGVLIVPESASRAMKNAAGVDPNSDEDPLLDALMEAMMEPVSDRDSASALVPLLLTVPDESANSFRHISFDHGLDSTATEMEEKAIHRLALGQDAPPELLLGTAGVNHWGAWLVQEDVVKTHVEPPLALFCDAVTEQFFRPALVETGLMDEDEAKDYVIWYDVDHMIVRPNRGSAAVSLHERGVLSDQALRDAHGFEETDEPVRSGEAEGTARERAVDLALAMVQRAPSLAIDPGLLLLIEQINQALQGAASGTAPALPAVDRTTPDDSDSVLPPEVNEAPEGEMQ